jgi:hypothetical protein
MNKILDLFSTDTWKTLVKKPLLYVGFHEKNGSSYIVVSTQKELMFMQRLDGSNQTRNGIIEQLQSFISGSPVIFNPSRTEHFFKNYSAV